MFFHADFLRVTPRHLRTVIASVLGTGVLRGNLQRPGVPVPPQVILVVDLFFRRAAVHAQVKVAGHAPVNPGSGLVDEILRHLDGEREVLADLPDAHDGLNVPDVDLDVLVLGDLVEGVGKTWLMWAGK